MGEVEQARENSVVEALYLKVDAQTPITFRPLSGKNWSSSTNQGQTEIGHVPTRFPAEALYHELLHADLKNAGYVQNIGGITSNSHGFRIKSLIGMLDNELQHHRMFNDFLKAGFSADHFYCDTDVNTYKRTRRELQGVKPGEFPSEYLRMFLPIIAPGGAGTEGDRQKLRTFFQSKCPNSIMTNMLAIESVIYAWGSNNTIDPTPVMAEIIRLLSEFDRVWIGSSNIEFNQGGGYFIGSKFTILEALWL